MKRKKSTAKSAESAKKGKMPKKPCGAKEGFALEFKTAFPKNPTICTFMIQIGRYEELGSGVRKVNHYLPHHAPGAGKPMFEDGDMFKVVVPLVAATTPQGTPEVAVQTESGLELGPESITVRVLMSLRETCFSKSEIADALGHTSISSPG